ncbi:MAG: hypothetical protein COB41_00570 [Proteobacteria bacterium]|nr:MAG: hypothetical protein COB41_00570 [Pseudomonadota bacterium]
MKKDNVYNLYEYVFAKKVTKEVPGILLALDKMQLLCYDHMEYRDIANVMSSINEAKLMLELHLDAYKPVAEKKGKRDGKKKQ